MDTCAECKHYDEEGTSLPVCVLHKKFTRGDWTCGDCERRGNGETDKAEVR